VFSRHSLDLRMMFFFVKVACVYKAAIEL